MTEQNTPPFPIITKRPASASLFVHRDATSRRVFIYKQLWTQVRVRGVASRFTSEDKENEEIYGILSGNGKAIIDGEEISLSTGDWLKIAPAAKRQFFASDISGITYICIQVKENSLEHFTAEDAVIG